MEFDSIEDHSKLLLWNLRAGKLEWVDCGKDQISIWTAKWANFTHAHTKNNNKIKKPTIKKKKVSRFQKTWDSLTIRFRVLEWLLDDQSGPFSFLHLRHFSQFYQLIQILTESKSQVLLYSRTTNKHEYSPEEIYTTFLLIINFMCIF